MAKGRTQNDEDEYNAHLRREEPIKTEVIVELKEQNRALIANQAKLLETVLYLEDALRVYRIGAFEYATRASKMTSHCVPGCTKHEWRTEDGWHYMNEGV